MVREPALDPAGLARALERLTSLIPGYTGYRSLEQLQEEDRVVRGALARQLGMILGRGERALRNSRAGLPGAEAEDARNSLEALGRCRDRIHFAPAGADSFFARSSLSDMDRQTLLALDAALWAALSELEILTGEWDQEAQGGEAAWPGDRLLDALFELEEALDERESFLRR
jgi:hypothetical protein